MSDIMGETMKTPNDYSIDMAYSYASSADLRRYYNDSAKEYDDFADSVNYVLPARVVEIAAEHFGDRPERAIDVGCGTGLVGVEVVKLMPSLILEGLDLSSSMILEAYEKKKENGQRCYSSLIYADATREKCLQPKHYALMLSAGTFTLGHLGPEHLDMLLDSLVDSGLAVISIKSDHFENEGFLDYFSSADKDGLISMKALISVDSYDNPEYSAESTVAVFEKRG